MWIAAPPRRPGPRGSASTPIAPFYATAETDAADKSQTRSIERHTMLFKNRDTTKADRDARLDATQRLLDRAAAAEARRLARNPAGWLAAIRDDALAEQRDAGPLPGSANGDGTWTPIVHEETAEDRATLKAERAGLDWKYGTDPDRAA
jgi:hypothetical protein